MREPVLPGVPVATEPPMPAFARTERPAPPPKTDPGRERRCRLAAVLAALLLHAAMIAALLITPPHQVSEPPAPIPVALVFEPPAPPPPPPQPVAKPSPAAPPLRSNHSGDLDLPPGPAKEAGAPGTDPNAEQPPAVSPKDAQPAEQTESPPAAAAPPPMPEPPSAPSPAASPTPPAETPSPSPPAPTPVAPASQAEAPATVPGPLLAPRPPAAERQAEIPTPPLPHSKPAAEPKPPPSRPSPPARTIGRPAPATAHPGPAPKVAQARGSPDRSGGDPYLNTVVAHVNKHLQYPNAARPLNLAGVAKFEILVRRDGTIIDGKLVQSSGAEILDKAAIDALRHASPLPPLPPGLPDPTGMWLTIPVIP